MCFTCITACLHQHHAHRGFTDSRAGIVKRSLSIIVLDIWVTVSFIHQTSDYIEMTLPGVKILLCNNAICVHVHACIVYKLPYTYVCVPFVVLTKEQSDIIDTIAATMIVNTYSMCHSYRDLSRTSA